MKSKFTVYFMKPVVTWTDVMAEDEDKAIAKCSDDPGAGLDVYSDGEPFSFVAIEESDDEDIPND